ncbi:hypothetical protein M413DRAFT_441827 [Hebeloma cylindrosporum]|uniref:Altered inheritance of mitochondria protein 41 n=1 Tax=Hebeloma cylindrosporum TaxID=76867 RepID=A0A0C3CM33_HEBCY|nr:hypothetical protein M413DRAFT_441827 [Hebeloma cylindrosporum h7]
MAAIARVSPRLRISYALPRFYSVNSGNPGDLRVRLQSEVKEAMKNRETKVSTTLRSVLSEINAAEKVAKVGLSSSAAASIVRKAVQLRTEASAKFTEAGRQDLADLEQEEAVLLSKFLPPQLSAIEIDTQLMAIMDALPKDLDRKKLIGVVFKEFYSKVDKSSVDTNLVKERAQDLIKSLTLCS